MAIITDVSTDAYRAIAPMLAAISQLCGTHPWPHRTLAACDKIIFSHYVEEERKEVSVPISSGTTPALRMVFMTSVTWDTTQRTMRIATYIIVYLFS